MDRPRRGKKGEGKGEKGARGGDGPTFDIPIIPSSNASLRRTGCEVDYASAEAFRHGKTCGGKLKH